MALALGETMQRITTRRFMAVMVVVAAGMCISLNACSSEAAHNAGATVHPIVDYKDLRKAIGRMVIVKGQLSNPNKYDKMVKGGPPRQTLALRGGHAIYIDPEYPKYGGETVVVRGVVATISYPSPIGTKERAGPSPGKKWLQRHPEALKRQHRLVLKSCTLVKPERKN